MSNEITRFDGDHKPCKINPHTGEVSRPLYIYRATLKPGLAVDMFLESVGMYYSDEVSQLIQACNKAATRKTLKTWTERIAYIHGYMKPELDVR